MRLVLWLGWLLLSCGLVSCSSYQVQTTTDTGSSRERLFPDGVYRHQVKLQFANGKSAAFLGVVSIKPELIEVVGLGPFNTTVFRLKDDRKTNEVTTEIFIERMKKHEDRVREFYGLLRTLLLLPAKPQTTSALEVTPGPDGFPATLATRDRDPQAKLEIGEYDERHIPRRLTLSDPRFTVEVKVAGYEI